MKRKWKKILPSPHHIKQHKLLQIFGERLHSPNLWHLNRVSLARGVAVGLFTAFIPLPFQMLIAASFAILVNANMPLSIILVWITNPITMPAIFFTSYELGVYLLKITPSHSHSSFEFSLKWFFEHFIAIWEPLFLGSFILGGFCALIGFIIVKVSWRFWVMHHWSLRKIRFQKKK